MGEEPTIYEMSPDELKDFITDLFVEFDTDQNGHLDRKEFKAVMKTAKLGLSNKDIRAIMAEADEDGSGFIEYREFVPLMVDLITLLKAKEEAAMNRLDEEEVRERQRAGYIVERERIRVVCCAVRRRRRLSSSL